MLISPSPDHLKLLDAKEALIKYKAENERKDDIYRLPDQEVLSNVEVRIGKPMSHTDLVNKILKLARHSIWVEDSWGYKNGMNFYTIRNGEKVCLNAAFEKGWLPEFTVIHLNERKLPYRKTVGWRQVLANLRSQGVITLAQERKYFGYPQGLSSERWHKSTQHLR